MRGANNNMNYQDIFSKIKTNFPVICEAYITTYNEDPGSSNAEAYFIRKLTEEIEPNMRAQDIDWKAYGDFISEEKIRMIKEYYTAMFEVRKKFNSFLLKEKKDLTALLNEQSDKIGCWE